MHIYVTAAFNHLRALQAWAAERDAKLTIDVRTFQLEVKHRGRYFNFFPMFQARVDGRWAHATELPNEAVGFGGWRPYRPLKHSHSTEKLPFKRFLRERELPTPRFTRQSTWPEAPDYDYLVKADVGSFGRQIHGPFAAGRPAAHSEAPAQSGEPTTYFAEQFVLGQTCKVWFWGARPFFAHAHEFPTIVGNGSDTVDRLLSDKLKGCLLDWGSFLDRDTVLGCLRYQGVEPHEVLAHGREVFIDYRYSQRYEPTLGITATSDNVLPVLLANTGEQIPALGSAVAALLHETYPAPILVSVDAILDDGGTLQWLEMNTNSLMPPDGYAVMLSDLFG